jgi:hypothetical protein
MTKESESHNFLIILSLLLISCGDPHSQNERSKKISIANFNENVWKADTLGCQNKRIDLAMVLRDSMQKCLVGKSKASLIELLGPPNTTHFHRGDTVYTYFVRSDRQCYDTLWRENGSHAEQLLIFISKDGNISGSTGPIYP